MSSVRCSAAPPIVSRTLGLVLAAIGMLLGCRSAPPRAAAGPEFLTSARAAELSLPFSEAVRAGDFLFLSGQIGIAPGQAEPVPGGIGPESAQAMDNIKAILERHGSSLEAVVKCTVFLADIREWPAFNTVYRTYFTRHFPARSALAASGLALGARVEVECLAYAPSARQ